MFHGTLLPRTSRSGKETPDPNNEKARTSSIPQSSKWSLGISLASLPADLSHFGARLARTIEDFSRTERAKFPADPAPLPRHGLTPDDLCLLRASTAEYAFPPMVDLSGQPIAGWALDSEALCGGNTPRPLKDALSILIAEGQLELPLRLVRNVREQGDAARYHSNRALSFGWQTISWCALLVYLGLNVLEHLHPALRSISLAGSEWRRADLPIAVLGQLFGQSIMHYSPHNAQDALHMDFWVRRQGAPPVGPPEDDRTWPEHRPDSDVLEDRERLRDYLRECFKLIYRTDLLVRELGAKPIDWEKEIGSMLWWAFRFDFDFAEAFRQPA